MTTTTNILLSEPSKEYTQLIGAAVCIYNTSYCSMIASLIAASLTDKTIRELFDMKGHLALHAKDEVSTDNLENDARDLYNECTGLFSGLTKMRNKLVHSFTIITEESDDAVKNVRISLGSRPLHHDLEEYEQISIDDIKGFIGDNEKLSNKLIEFRKLTAKDSNVTK